MGLKALCAHEFVWPIPMPIRITLMTLGAVWFLKCNVNGNNNGLHLITSGNKFE
jgi:hypothetical protein